MSDLVKQLVAYKNDPTSSWLSEVSSVALQQSMRHLADAFARFFKTKRGYPRLKYKDHHRQSFTLMDNAFRFKDGKFYIACCDTPIKVHFTRELPSEPSSLTISRDSTGQHYVSFVCQYYPTKTSGKGCIGIDLGLKDFITTSDGIKVESPKYLRHAQTKLRRLQKTLSRRKKGSANYAKARTALAAQHRRVANCRKDFHHQLSRRLINENQVIGLEILTIQYLVRNRRLSKSFADAGIASFTSMLNYKAAESQQCQIVYVSKWYPSTHLCSTTNMKLERKLKLSERSWLCPHCSRTHDRDTNAAKNILKESLRILEQWAPDTPGGVTVGDAALNQL